MTVAAQPPRSAKRATNITLSRDAFDAAKALNLNVSQVCETALRKAIAIEQARRWLTEHREFIEKFSHMIEREGPPLDKWRTF